MADNISAGTQTPEVTDVNLDQMTIKEKCNKIIDILKPYTSKVSWDWGEGNTIIIKPGHGKEDFAVETGYPHPSVSVEGNTISIFTGPDNTGGHWEYIFDAQGNLLKIVWVSA